MRHFLRNDVASAQTISIIVAGCGGNGAALLTGLARLDHALAQTSDRRLFVTVRRQNIWRSARRKLAECGPRLEVDVRRRACGVASADIRWSVA